MKDFHQNHPMPHPVLTNIRGKPTFITLDVLITEAYANAMSVPTNNGGGRHGHLGAITTPNYYATISQQNTAFVHPPQPAAQAPPTGTIAQVTELTRIYNETRQIYQLYNYVCTTIKNQIIAAIDLDYINALRQHRLGFANVTTLQLIGYLQDEYGAPNANDHETYRNQLSEARNPDEPIQKFFNKVARICDLVPSINSEEKMAKCRLAFQKTGIHDQPVMEWDRKPPIDHTWANFITHFKSYEEARANAIDARQAGYSSANGATADIPPPAVPPQVPEPARCPTATESQPGDLTINYCWTHGFTRARKKHTSKTCTSRAHGHDINATWKHPLGGSCSIKLLYTGFSTNPPPDE